MKKEKENESKLVFGFTPGEEEFYANLAKSDIQLRTGSYSGGVSKEEDKSPPTLLKSIINVLNGTGQSIERLAFENNPAEGKYAGVYKQKLRLIPDVILKRIAIQDSLVSNIVRARQNHISAFGRPRLDRFSTGFSINPNTGVIDGLDEQGKLQLKKQIEAAVKKLYSCGSTAGLDEEERATFPEYLSLSVRSAVVVGRIATEIVWTGTGDDKKFHHFVATDAGTIYKANNEHSAQEAVRNEAYQLLCQATGEKLIPEKFRNNDYKWVQVIEGQPRQVFTSDEMKVYNFYAVPDVELDGYPVTPIDTVITAVTTHINIVTHNRLYFQSGRASRGMLVIKSDDATPQNIHNIKQHFNASINNVNNSWRMPVFGCGMGEEIDWKPMDTGGGKDMEFQYLTDMNAREILTAFMMSPDELPGWSYLSRGTNNQALSEGNNEYKIEAARDVGIRPLLAGFEDFINTHLFPLIDPELAKKARVRLVGLDTDNAEKEAVRTQQDMGIWMSYDDILERVEKKPLGREWGGSLPLNAVYKSYLDQYFTVGEVLEHFCGREGAAKDAGLAYRCSPFFFQWVQLQQEAAQAQAAQAAQPPGGGGPSGGGGGGQQPQQDQSSQSSKDSQAYPAKTEKQKTDESAEASASGGASGGGELARSIDIAFDYLTKSERDLPPEKRRQLAQQRQTVDTFMRGWLQDLQETTKEILDVAEHHAPKK